MNTDEDSDQILDLDLAPLDRLRQHGRLKQAFAHMR